jgi:GNAT superfamily N-acetyltransferase
VLEAAALDIRRITLFRAYDGPIPLGFRTVERSLLMAFEGEPPAMPPEVGELPHPQHQGEEAYADQLEELHRRQAAAGARTFGIERTAWAVVANGCIDDVWVEEPRRGEGLGRIVMTAALAAGGWFLWCLEDDPRPQTLYRSLGLRETGRVVQLTRG